MADIRPRMFTLLVLLVLFSLADLPGSDGAPEQVEGDIEMNKEWPLIPNEEGETVMEIIGSFTLSTKSLQDAPWPVTATLSVSEGQWDATPRQTEYIIEETGTWERFYIDVVIPQEVMTGESSSYTVTIHFQGRFSDSTAQEGFLVRIESGSMDDQPTDTDDENDTSTEGDLKDSGSFPIWPIFLLILIVALVIVGIWAYRNIELVREVDGKKRIYLREKDTGRILGKDR